MLSLTRAIIYRIKTISKQDLILYSQVKKVNINTNTKGINVYPNPVKSNILNLQINNLQKGKYNLNMFSISGQKILTKVLEHPGGSSFQIIRIENLFPGPYQVWVSGPGGAFKKKLIKY